MNNFFYKVNDKDYEVVVIYKRIKNIHYKFKDGKFVISCNRLVGKQTLIKGLDKFAEKLISRSKKESPIGDDYIYIFGEKIIINQSGTLHIEGYKDIEYKSHEDLLKKIRPIYLDVITKRTRYYESVMNLPSYKVTVRNMTSRFGSNSKSSKHITIAMTLLHYSFPIIDSVIVHELAHIKVYNHSKAFYDVVYAYCPDYDALRKKLIKGEFK